tara:strand:- start:9670 stop:10659 length:990 start_codon:yes stop_codon:yes gene_type:complete
MAIRHLTEDSAGQQDSIKSRINQLLPDNNSGRISAADIRVNLEDIVDSILENVASGDFSTAGNPFQESLRLQKNLDPLTDAVRGGILVVDSGIQFGSSELQTVPYPGPESINHNDLTNRAVGNPHPQYVQISGDSMTGALGMGGYRTIGGVDIAANSISSRGPFETEPLGIYFEWKESNLEHVHLGSGSNLEFDRDHSVMTSAIGQAHAYIRFSSSPTTGVEVQSSMGIDTIERIDSGKYTIRFDASHVFDPLDSGNYVVVAHCNGTSAAGSAGDMDLVNAAAVVRSGDVFTLAVQNDGSQYVDAKINDVVVYGVPSGVKKPTLATVVT